MRAVRVPVLVSSAAIAVAATFVVPSASAHDVARGPNIERMRKVLGHYENPATAVAAGYVPDPICAQSPQGVMGHHYLNPWLVDGRVQAYKPEVLVYQPVGEKGALRLVAVEYLMLEREAKRHPHLKGIPFEGPMAGHTPGMPDHYDLHVWLFQDNPDGMFASWNPAGTCGT